MKLTKFDIGAEIISILTRGMYPDPRDAVREYIQNAIDAKAENLDVKVRQNSVVIEDDGDGMDYQTLRNALRVGVSDKRPGEDVGFMGIGIYSAFHLCETLTIYSRRKNTLPQVLKMNFKGMRFLLKEQKQKRFNKEITSEDLTDLQTLLETYIELPDEGEISKDEYPVKNGTRVELVGLHKELDDLLNQFDGISNYLQDVVPLRFNKEFKWGPMIEKKILEVCKHHNSNFELVNIKLQVGSQIKNLYRPYTNDLFTNNTPFEPDFIEIKSGNVFLGVAWGCLNSARERIKLPKKDTKKRNLRGFVVKKQGFSIGTREDLSKYFGGSNTFYHRYTGEVIIVNNQMLPNAARNDLEASDLRKKFRLQLQTKVAPYFIAIANKFQETDKAKADLEEMGNALKKVLVDYNPNDDNYNNYLDQISELDVIIKKLKGKKSKMLPEQKTEAEKVISSAEKLKREVLLKFNVLVNKKNRRKKPSKKNVTKDVAGVVKKYTARDITTKYESLLDLLNDLDIDFNEEVGRLFQLIDENFIQGEAKSKNNYYQLLNQLKEDFENE